MLSAVPFRLLYSASHPLSVEFAVTVEVCSCCCSAMQVRPAMSAVTMTYNRCCLLYLFKCYTSPAIYCQLSLLYGWKISCCCSAMQVSSNPSWRSWSSSGSCITSLKMPASPRLVCHHCHLLLYRTHNVFVTTFAHLSECDEPSTVNCRKGLPSIVEQ